MSLSRPVLLLAAALALSIPAQTQQTPTTIERDKAALSLLGNVVSAMGEDISGAKSGGVIAHGMLKAAPGGISGEILWKTSGKEFRYERPGPNGTILFVSGHGNPAIADGSKVLTNTIGHLAMTVLPPHLVAPTLASLVSNPVFQISSVQQVDLDGLKAIQISTVDTSDEITAAICRQDWFFDPATLLPLRVDFLVAEASNALNTAKMTYIFANYQRASGLLVPFSVTTLFNGQQIEVITFDSIQVGAAIPATDFDAPAATNGGAL